MARATKSKTAPEPKAVGLTNASGKSITAYVVAGVMPRKDPFLEMHKLLKDVSGIKPSPLPK